MFTSISAGVGDLPCFYFFLYDPYKQKTVKEVPLHIQSKI